MNLIKDIEKRNVILFICKGSDTYKKLMFELDIDKRHYDKLIAKLASEELIDIESGRLIPTLKGLLYASNNIFKKDSTRYETNDKNTFLKYSNEIRKDVIFLPYLRYDERNNCYGDDLIKVYKTEIGLSNFDINIMQVIENCLYRDSYSDGCFWIIKNDIANLCGFEIRNMINAINQYKFKDYEIKVAFSDSTYILFVRCITKNNKVEKILLEFYLSNCGKTPYIDVLDYINKKLQIFLHFVNIKNIPFGKEVIIKIKKNLLSAEETKNELYYPLRFVPEICGKIFFKDKVFMKHELPLIIAINPNKIRGDIRLKKVSPWFICCSGGFIEDDFKDKRKFQLQYFKQYELDDVIIVQLIVTPYT